MKNKSQNNNITILDQKIHTQDSLYSLNDLHKASGGLQKHQPNKFIRINQTKSLIAEMIKCPDVGIKPISIKKGRFGGTYACKELVYSYAMWISPKFNLTVIRTFDNLLQTNSYTYEQPKQLDRSQANQALEIVNDFVKNYGIKHAPKGQHIDSRRGLKQAHDFIHRYFNVGSYKGLDNDNLLVLHKVLKDNATAIFANAKDLFVIDLRDNSAIQQTEDSIRITSPNGTVRYLSLSYVLDALEKVKRVEALESKKESNQPSESANVQIPHHIEVVLNAVQNVLINCHSQIDMAKSTESNLSIEERIKIMKGIAPNFKVCTTNIEMATQSMFIENYEVAKNTSVKEVLDNIGYSIL